MDIGSTHIKEIYIEGHTDSFATADHNSTLAANRASATSLYLTQLGVPSRFIKVESFGESQLISENHSHNRRARVFFIHETDHKSTMEPPKFIVIKTIDQKTKNPILANLGFDYNGQEMKFSHTGKNGISETFSMLGQELTIMASAPNHLSQYLTIPLADLEKPVDTLIYTIPLPPVQVTGKFTFSHIYFHTDSDKIKPESQPDLLKLLALLTRQKEAYIEIQGHMNYPMDRPTNSVQRRYNMELSYKRAKAINDYLVQSGISQNRLSYKGMSNTRMKYKIPYTREQEDQNKRVEIYTLKQI